ncbi:hypothetical protein GCM10028818_53290 [Spirosoma horti]
MFRKEQNEQEQKNDERETEIDQVQMVGEQPVCLAVMRLGRPAAGSRQKGAREGSNLTGSAPFGDDEKSDKRYARRNNTRGDYDDQRGWGSCRYRVGADSGRNHAPCEGAMHGLPFK